jgi:hypothetical protein
MFDSPATRIDPDEFARRLDEAKARAAVLRQQALRDFGSSLVAFVRRLARAVRGTGATSAARLPESPAVHATR